MTADFERREEGEEAPPARVRSFPCGANCGRRNERSGVLCAMCSKRVMSDFDVSVGAAFPALIAENNLAYYVERSEKFAAVSKREQVRILVLAADDAADVLFATEKERSWAASMRKGFPELGRFAGGEF